jgi:hypothetical protein
VNHFGVLLALGLGLVHARASAATSVQVRCPNLAPETAAAFEARAHTELLVRGLSGSLWLDCSGVPRLVWSPARGSGREREVEIASVDALLVDLVSLLDAPEPPAPEAPTADHQERPRSAPGAARKPLAADLRLGALGRLWNGQAALGTEIELGLPIAPLTLTVSGNFTRGALSYGNVSLYVLETRAGAELFLLDAVRIALGIGAGRPFTTETANVVLVDASQSLWFVEGFLRASVPKRVSERLRFEIGAEAALFSRPVRLLVDQTRGYDFGWQPGVFLQAAYEL